jgi:hypothetical protein
MRQRRKNICQNPTQIRQTIYLLDKVNYPMHRLQGAPIPTKEDFTLG